GRFLAFARGAFLEVFQIRGCAQQPVPMFVRFGGPDFQFFNLLWRQRDFGAGGCLLRGLLGFRLLRVGGCLSRVFRFARRRRVTPVGLFRQIFLRTHHFQSGRKIHKPLVKGNCVKEPRRGNNRLTSIESRGTGDGDTERLQSETGYSNGKWRSGGARKSLGNTRRYGGVGGNWPTNLLFARACRLGLCLPAAP